MATLRDRLVQSLAPRAGYRYIRLLRRTMRLEYRNREALDGLRTGQGRYILAFWHARFVMMRFAFEDEPMVVLASRHRDAQMLCRILERQGLDLAYGSSTQGGVSGMRDVLRRIRDGYNISITPDGPRGPKRKLKQGAVAMARLGGLPILPVAFSASPAYRVGSWDRTLLPYPFARGLYLYGEPIRVPREADEAEQRRLEARLQAELDRLTDEADREVGLPVESR